MPHLPVSIPSFAAFVGSSAVLALAILVGLKGVPAGTPAANPRTGPGERGLDPWRLRTSDVAITSSIATPGPKGRQASEMSEEPRAVRVVYPGLTGSR